MSRSWQHRHRELTWKTLLHSSHLYFIMRLNHCTELHFMKLRDWQVNNSISTVYENKDAKVWCYFVCNKKKAKNTKNLQNRKSCSRCCSCIAMAVFGPTMVWPRRAYFNKLLFQFQSIFYITDPSLMFWWWNCFAFNSDFMFARNSNEFIELLHRFVCWCLCCVGTEYKIESWLLSWSTYYHMDDEICGENAILPRILFACINFNWKQNKKYVKDKNVYTYWGFSLHKLTHAQNSPP